MQHKSDNGYVMQKVENEMAGNLYTVCYLAGALINRAGLGRESLNFPGIC